MFLGIAPVGLESAQEPRLYGLMVKGIGREAAAQPPMGDTEVVVGQGWEKVVEPVIAQAYGSQELGHQGVALQVHRVQQLVLKGNLSPGFIAVAMGEAPCARS
jgi:hypothetical protein